MKYHESIQFDIPIGSSGQIDIKVPFRKLGFCKGLLLVNTATEPTENVDFKINSTGGNEILPNMYFKLLYQRNGGSYADSMLPIKFNEKDVVVTFTIDANLVNKFRGQLVFFFNSKEQELFENTKGITDTSINQNIHVNNSCRPS